MVSCLTEELEDSVLLSSSADDQNESQELSSQVTMDLASALASTDIFSDSGSPPAEPLQLPAESTDPQSFATESSEIPDLSAGDLSLPVDSHDPAPAEDPPCPASADLLQSSVDDSLALGEDGAAGSEEESVELLDVAPAQPCSHMHDDEEPEEAHLD